MARVKTKEKIQKLYMALQLQKKVSVAWTNETDTDRSLETQINGPNPADSYYISWLEKHPSALSCFESMMSGAEGKKIVLFLDYDGTLSPIVNDPDCAFMSESMRSVLREVARYFPTAIVSGRSREKVYEFVQLKEVHYAGSHGMDIMQVDEKGNESTIFQPAKEYLPSINKMLEELKESTCGITGAFIEDNTFCISVHYRHVLDEDCGILEEAIHNVLSGYPRFHVTRGKKVMEIRPSIKWNKGDALVYLLHTLGFSNSAHALPLYIGDDKTDEDAFKVLRGREQGYPIIVSTVPRHTSASHSLEDPSEVLSFLIHLAKWGRDMSLT